MKDEFVLTTPHFTLEGRSRAGHETWFRIRDLGIALDVGRGPDEVVSMDHVFVTHAHLDHIAGVPFYAAQRHLQRLEGGTVYVPAESHADMRLILDTYKKMTGTSGYEIELAPMAEGDEVRVGRHHVVRAHSATHRVAARAYEVIESRRHLLDEYAGRDGTELARLRSEGIEIDGEYNRSLLFYTGDTDRGILERNEPLFRSEVLLIECSFVMDGHQDRAAQYRHIHIDDIADFAGKFENELIVLTHFSRRYSREQLRDTVRRRVPHTLRDRIRLALPEPFQKL